MSQKKLFHSGSASTAHLYPWAEHWCHCSPTESRDNGLRFSWLSSPGAEPQPHKQVVQRIQYSWPAVHGVELSLYKWGLVGGRESQVIRSCLSSFCNIVLKVENKKCWTSAFFNHSEKGSLVSLQHLLGTDISSLWSEAGDRGRSGLWFKCHRLTTLFEI